MTKDQILGAARVILSVIGILLAVFLVSNEQAAACVGLTKPDLQDPARLLARLGFVFRLALVPTIILLSSLLFCGLRRILNGPGKKVPTGRLVSSDSVIKTAVAYLESHPEAYSLRVWGYSLNWASDLTLFLAEHRRAKLAVAVFVPTEAVIGVKFNDVKSEERKAVLRLRTSEWKEIQTRGMAKSVDIYSHDLIPNDIGILVDDTIAFFGSYDWEEKSNEIWHKRQPLHERLFIRLERGDRDDEFMIEKLRRRFRCREFDAAQRA